MRIVLIVVGVLVALLLIGLFAVTRGMKDIRQLSIEDPDISSLQDGTYEGSYHKTRWNYGVRVTIEDGRIAGIEFTEKPDDGKFSGEAVDAVLQAQSLQIDTVSGASINTRAFQKAVENALAQAPRK
jgi:uncharacterized protein with FMN-binding domain